MSKSTKVTVNDLHHFSLTSNDVNALDSVQTDQDHFHIIKDHISYTAELYKSDFHNKSYEIKIDNTLYVVNIDSELDTLIKKMGFESAASKKIDAIKAPMPGLILDIFVKIGDVIESDTPLLVLEAMKMENSIVAPHDGIIKSIAVTKGITVDKGDLLIEFE